MKSHCPNELVLYLATDGRRYSPLAGGVPRSQPSTLWTLKYIADGSYPLIQGSPDLVQLFVDAEAARALVRRVTGIFVNLDSNRHSRKFNLYQWVSLKDRLESNGLYCCLEVEMFFKKPKPVACAVCGNTIDPKERRYLEKNRATKVERHTHIDCHKPIQGTRVSPN